MLRFIAKMERENFIVVAGLTAVAAICSFVLWGPPSFTRSKKRSAVVGLQNLGLTCYLNSLLQALASCHYFVHWLNCQRYEAKVAGSLKTLLSVLSGNSEVSGEHPFVSPIDVVQALNEGGWRVSNTQQDVHELLCNMIGILEEEAYKSCADLNIPTDSSASTSNGFLKHVSLENVPNGNVACHTSHKDLISSDSNGRHTLPKRNKLNGVTRYFRMDSVSDLKPSSSRSSISSLSARMKHSNQDLSQNPKPSPFRGYLINRIECTKCSYKSVLRCDKFDIVSLHLPEHGSETSIYTLPGLLNNFVKQELISDLSCEGCNQNRQESDPPITSPAMKLLRFAKLPSCLCFHIVRTSFHDLGIYKRQDYVDFPEFLIMDPYIYRATRNNSFTTEDSEMESSPADIVQEKPSGIACKLEKLAPKYIYKLQAVIIHRGSHNDGHFMTYRRGIRDSDNPDGDKRWFLVSDVDVKETSLYSVLSSVAYVLFYEKCCPAG